MTQADIGNRPAVPRRGTIAAVLAAAMVGPVLAIRGPAGIAADPGDLVFLALLTGGALLAIELAARIPSYAARGAGAAFAVAAGAIGLWINLAVGIVGSEDDPVNRVFAVPAALAVVGAVAVRMTPGGLARVMIVAAVAQLLAAVVVAATGAGFTGPITLFLTTLWLAAAALFARHRRG